MGDHGGDNVCSESAWDTAYVALDLCTQRESLMVRQLFVGPWHNEGV